MNTLFRKIPFRIVMMAWLCGVAGSASAATIPGLFNTGVLNDGTTAASGSVDLHYSLFVSPDLTFPGPNAIVANPIATGYWLANSSTSRWIGPAENQGYPTGAANHATGEYVYRLTFDLTGLDPATANITGTWAADNQGTAIRLNGAITGNTTPGYSVLTAFTITSGFIGGINTLDFVVDEFAAGGANPTGLRVDGIAGTASLVPAPAAGWLLGTGLLGVFGWRRRRRPQA